jgi:hypothetical protein
MPSIAAPAIEAILVVTSYLYQLKQLFELCREIFNVGHDGAGMNHQLVGGYGHFHFPA